MPVTFVCPHCQTRLKVKEQALGKTVRCPTCSKRIVVQDREPEIPVAEIVAEVAESGENVGFLENRSATNPYTASRTPGPSPQTGEISQKEIIKIEAIIADAKLVAVAILLCLLCSGIGFLVIGPWYYARLNQWNKFSNQYPLLMDENAQYGSLAQRFQAAKPQLTVGLAVGGMMLCIALLIVSSFIPLLARK